jgi:hypothetical protein
MVRPLLIALALIASFGVTASADDAAAPTRWEWRCQGTVHGMEVSPDGRQTTYRPERPSGFQFRIRERDPEGFYVRTLKLPRFFIDFEGSSSLWSSQHKDRATQTLDGWGDDRKTHAGPEFSLEEAAKKNDLKEVNATLNKHLMAIALERDDQGWRFIMSRTDIRTLRSARELRASAPSVKWKPKADATAAMLETI